MPSVETRTAPLPARTLSPALVFGNAIVLSAFLLFLAEPLIAKMILPWFGGSAALWASCMLFFQMVLLGGYAYADWLNAQTVARQKMVHLTLLGLSCLFLPIVPSPFWKPNPGDNPLLRIPSALAATVGLPSFILASTSPLLQSWYARSAGGAMPYRFFAWSSAGSILGLLSYPVIVEPWLTNRQQAWIWSICYAAFAILCVWSALRLRIAHSLPVGPSPGFRQSALWIGLAACPSALLLAVTNHITQNIAAVPLLWVLPLGLYLVSFVLTFDSDRWYRRRFFGPLAPVACFALAYAIYAGNEAMSVGQSLTLCCASMFALCMVCHGELALRRPAPRRLTSFYLMIAAGGAIGGLFIGLAAPWLFNALYDLPIVLSLTGFLLVYLFWLAVPSPAMATTAAGIAVGLALLLARDTWGYMGYARLLSRNFYGSLVVYDEPSSGPMGPVRVLRNGIIDHGEQFLWTSNRRYPTTYYGRRSGVGLTIQALMEHGPVNVGLIGLGAGTLAAYGRTGDRYSIYEINPNVVTIAKTQFTFLHDCPSRYEIIMGDARLSLERDASRQFDLLVVDAFSGDAIPVHLLTREAFRLYWRHLKPDGVLAVHISNKHLSLGPVVAMAASEQHRRAMLISYDGNGLFEEMSSDWALVTSRPNFFEIPGLREAAREIDPIPGLRMWSDDYSNLYKVLR